jgi:hypothetical protein
LTFVGKLGSWEVEREELVMGGVERDARERGETFNE